ncbi:hypothetical protein D1BOALGB6SA_7242 [Olavius sp. associated proteobacterium Delta 1]|nr:hypothetical protein D1BOALGB6SA_7242 [Olavius sp. associated proteobacterium Delta 1]
MLDLCAGVLIIFYFQGAFNRSRHGGNNDFSSILSFNT